MKLWPKQGILNMPQLSDIKNKTKGFKKKSYRSYTDDASGELNNKLKEPCSLKASTQQDLVAKKTSIQPNIVNVVEILPEKCRPWMFADRGQYEMGNIEELANSIKANGQQEPVLVRRISASLNDQVEYEVIFGHRRWLACSLCDKPLLAMVKELDDKSAAIAQKEENENRENLSDYARAVNYKLLLDNNVFKTNTELSAQLGIPRTTLNDILAYTKLPDVLLEQLQKPHLLPRRTAVKLSQLCKNISHDKLNLLCSLVPSIESGSIPYNKLSSILLQNKTDVCEKNATKNNVFKNSLNIKMFTSGLNHNKVPSLTFHKVVTENNLLPEIEELIYKFLKSKTERPMS